MNTTEQQSDLNLNKHLLPVLTVFVQTSAQTEKYFYFSDPYSAELGFPVKHEQCLNPPVGCVIKGHYTTQLYTLT